MADAPTDDELTDEQSNSAESDDQTDDSASTTTQVADTDDGNAAADDTTDDGGSEDLEGDKKTRGEVRHERYIDKLSEEIKQSNAISSQAPELFTPKPYEPLKYQEGEFDPKQLEEDRNKVADNKFAEGLQLGQQGTSAVVKELWADRYDTDSERVTLKWDALNPEKPETFSPKLEADLVQKYIKFAGITKDAKGVISIEKPNIRFRDFVDAEMKNLEEYAALRTAQSSKNLVKQAGNTGLRPGAQARPSKGDHGFDENDPVGSVARMTRKQYFELGGREASDAYLAKRGK